MIYVRTLLASLTLLSVALMAACSTPTPKRDGGFYKDDGPGSRTTGLNIDRIPDAIPRIETHSRATRKPYVVMGNRYVPLSSERQFSEEGVASWYGRKFHGRKTANGETYDMYAMTAAHPTLPIPSYARVTHVDNGNSVIVRINDRGPFHGGRVIDLSYVAAAKLNMVKAGKGRVVVEAITNREIASINSTSTAPEMDFALPTPKKVPDALSALPSGSIDVLPEAYQIYLQFGAFSSEENARALADRLNAEIGQVESRSAHLEPVNQLYRVQIGPYPSRSEAVNAALRIQEEVGTLATVAAR